jgi:hypothetical protein
VEGTLAAGLHNDGKREGLRIGVGFQQQGLRDAVIAKDKIVFAEREDNLAGFCFYQGWHEHQVRACGDGCGLRASQ